MYFKEYNDWFKRQLDLKDKYFEKNQKYFELKLNKLEIIYLLYKKKNFRLFLK